MMSVNLSLAEGTFFTPMANFRYLLKSFTYRHELLVLSQISI